VKKDKAKVIDEVWTEDRVRSFLDLEPPPGVDGDYHRLRRAYQSMRADDFRLFLRFFTEAGHDLDARGPEGETVLAQIADHRYAGPFVAALRDAGAS
jgi:hypothetical protein